MLRTRGSLKEKPRVYLREAGTVILFISTSGGLYESCDMVCTNGSKS
jgi:hypothetical protein